MPSSARGAQADRATTRAVVACTTLENIRHCPIQGIAQLQCTK
jgi:hypothetical protein